MAWKIIKDHLAEQYNFKSDVGVASVGIDDVDESTLTEHFKMYDDDGVLYYEGVSDDSESQHAFDPLDNFGQPNAGCTEIHYLDKSSGKYESL